MKSLKKLKNKSHYEFNSNQLLSFYEQLLIITRLNINGPADKSVILDNFSACRWFFFSVATLSFFPFS